VTLISIQLASLTQRIEIFHVCIILDTQKKEPEAVSGKMDEEKLAL